MLNCKIPLFLVILFVIGKSQGLQCYFKTAVSKSFELGQCPSNTNECFTTRCRSQVDAGRIDVLAGCFTRNFATMFQRNQACDPPHFCSYSGCNSPGGKHKSRDQHREEDGDEYYDNNGGGGGRQLAANFVGWLVASMAASSFLILLA